MSTLLPSGEIDNLISYVTDGYIPEEAARAVAGQDISERIVLADTLTTIDGQSLAKGEALRLDWLTRQLGKEPLNKTTFVEIVARRPELGRKQGLSSWAGVIGRHSSSYNSPEY